MMRLKNRVRLFLIAFLCVATFVNGQNVWPRDILTASGASITLYQPQPEALKGNVLSSRMVVSVKKDKKADPVFGVVWSDATLDTDRDTRLSSLSNFKVTQLKFPDAVDSTKLLLLKGVLESELPKQELVISIDEIVATLESDGVQTSDVFSVDPPEIIYASTRSSLVVIDGEPVVKMDDKIKMERVVNTPYLIVKNSADKKYYLSLGKYWYVANSVNGKWSLVKSVPSQIKPLDEQVKKNLKELEANNKTDSLNLYPAEIIIRLKPAELIQSNGEAQYANIEGTSLLYVKNSDDNIFKSVEDQSFYVLVSGRWYKSTALNGPWSFIASDKLPADFAKIPEGSEKDVVLASVAGTDAAKEAVRDAQIPQTAKVDRKTTTCTVTYEGEPKFEPIEKTALEMAVNSSLTVLKSAGKYYAVDNGVWFVSDQPKGPWVVSTDRPADVDKIPADNVSYNVKYVYVYDVTPEYVYVGYTPGYMGCYVYGPTVIYGTGYYYNPWYGPYYYPRPVTYGFSMHYNPYMGWSMGFTYNVGCFSFGIHGGGYGGYWGPPYYRPPYYGHYPPSYHGGYHGGYYGHNNGNTINNINIDRSNNIYAGNRNGVSTKDVRRPSNSTGKVNQGNKAGSSRPSVSNGSVSGGNTKPGVSTNDRRNSGASASNRQNNVYSDRSGNVYRNDNNGNWQQRQNNGWENSNKGAGNMKNSQYQRDRGASRSSSSYSPSTRSSSSRPSSGSYSRPSGGGGGGMRGGGGRR